MGASSSENQKQKYIDWLMYTVGMGVLPFFIRLFIAVLFSQILLFYDYHLDLFFVTIVLLVDSLKNFDPKCGKSKFALIILIISTVIYAVALLNSQDLLKVPLSLMSTKICTYSFLIASAILDFASIAKE